MRREQMLHSVVRPPQCSSCRVKPLRICSAFGFWSPSCGTIRWQKPQRISLAGHTEVRWDARSVSEVAM